MVCRLVPLPFSSINFSSVSEVISAVTIITLASGKLVCTGAKTEKDVYRSVNNLHSMLEDMGLMIYD